jgi:hypothetical protein
MEIEDDVLKWKLIWVDVGDERVCKGPPDSFKKRPLNCKFLSRQTPRTLPQWQKIGLPGSGHTKCKWKCRCILLPDVLFESFESLRGQTIDLRDDKNLRIVKETEYQRYTHLDNLISEYENITYDWNLPACYYDLYDLEERITFMVKLINDLKNRTISKEMIMEILKQNPRSHVMKWFKDIEETGTYLGYREAKEVKK